MKSIWIFNHYIIPPSIEDGHRHAKFAEHLKKQGFNPVLFYSSYLHRLKFNVIRENKKYIIDEIDGIKYVGLKTRSYTGNKTDRVLNMIDYFLASCKTTINFKNILGRPDIVIASSVHPLTCIAGIYVAKIFKVPCVIEIRDLWPLTLIQFGKIKKKSLMAKAMYQVEKWIYKKADRLIFTMEGGIDYIRDQGWTKVIDQKKICHINNGIDLEKYNFQKSEFEFDDVDLDDKNTFKVLYTGSLGEANAPDFIIEAAKELLDHEKIKIIIFGDGSQRKRLEEYCELHAISNVVFKGRVDKKYIPNILSKGNLNIFTGRSIDLYKYGISLNKLFDYLASGKPTLSNLKCGYDLLNRYRCGITVDGNNSHALADGMLKFYNMNNVGYNAYCKNALVAANDYDFKNLTFNLINVINDLLIHDK